MGFVEGWALLCWYMVHLALDPARSAGDAFEAWLGLVGGYLVMLMLKYAFQ